MSKKEEKKEKPEQTEDTTDEEEGESDDEIEEDWREQFLGKYLRVLCIFTIVLVVITGVAVISLLIFLYFNYSGEAESMVFSESVVIINPSNYDEVLSKDKNVMMMFYAPWCGHCKRSKPAYSQLAEKFDTREDDDEEVTIAALDCDSHKDLCSKTGIRGFPTFKLFKKGSWKEFSGQRTLDGFETFIEMSLGPVVIPLKNMDEVEKYFTKFKDKTVVVGTFHNDEKTEKTETHDVYVKYAEETDSMVFAELFVDDMDAREYTIFPFWDRTDKKTAALTKDKKVLDEELIFLGYPLVEEFNDSTFSRLKNEKKIICVLFLSEAQYFLKSVLEELAVKSRRRFITSHASAEHYKSQLKMMFGQEIEFPLATALDTVNGKEYLFEDNTQLSVDSLYLWMSGVIEGKIEGFYRSEPIPLKNKDEYAEGVKIVVGKSFEKFTFEGIPNLIFFGNKPAVEEKLWLLEELGQNYDPKELKIGAMNMSSNQFPPKFPLEVQPFKILFFDGVNTKAKGEDLGKWFMEAFTEGEEGTKKGGAAFISLKEKLDGLLGIVKKEVKKEVKQEVKKEVKKEEIKEEDPEL